MKKKSIIVHDTSRYWYYNDEEDKVWWFFNNFKIDSFFSEFYEKYYLLTKKYQILNTIKDYRSNDFFLDRKINNLSCFYNLNNSGLIFPTSLFTQVNYTIEKKNIIDVNKLLTLEDVKNSSKYLQYYFDEPIRIVEFGKKDNDMCINNIHIFIRNDVFFSSLFNTRTYSSEDVNVELNGINNSELAYLNTPRFNSFFRDFKKLCISYGAEFSYEIEIYETEDLVSPEGIFLDKEIIYYEDIVEMLDEQYQIVDLTIDTDFSKKK